MRIELRAALALPIIFGFFALCFGAIAAMPMPAGGRIVLGVFALVFLGLAILLGRRRLTVDDSDVTAKGMFGEKHLAWTEIDHYTFWSMDQQMVYAVGGNAGVAGAVVVGIIAAIVAASRNRGEANRRFAAGRLTLVGKTTIAIDGRYAKVTAALDPILGHLHALLAARRDFAPFTLTPGELVHAKKGPIALPDIEKISVGGGRLNIKKRGKRLAWLSVHMKQIHNGLLFIEALGEAGLVVDANAGMFVPPTVLDKLRAATARQQAMPAARVVRRD
ncbi:MAG: hypothetical protein JO257_35325 [Deltaproteobacteria bacterium]|nr:hypothetical protein [Deltaproteobacteria bacterium]